jgi:hypothetical protein
MIENLLITDKNDSDMPLSVVAIKVPKRVHFSRIAEDKSTRLLLKKKLGAVLRERFDSKPRIKSIEFNSNDYTFEVRGEYTSCTEKEEFSIGLTPISIV